MKTVKLDDLSLKVSSGLTPLRSNKEFWDNGTIPWLKTEQLGEKYIFDTSEYVSQTAINKTALKVFPENTLSIAMYGEGKTRGNVSIIKKPMTTNQACCNVELDKEKADYEYVYYFLKTQYEGLRSLSSGVRKNLNSNDIKNYPIRLPENIEEQQKIASVLSTLDEKIALNNQINATLEQMAKTLYDYWFVQFDFPDDNGKPYKSSGGEMVYNEILKRDIPKGWEIITLGKITICHDSKRVPLSSQQRLEKQGEYPYYGATGIFDFIDDYIFDGDYVLMAEDGSVMDDKGNPILQRIYGKTWVNNHAHVLEPISDYTCYLLMLLLKDVSVKKIKTGSIQMKINQENMNNIPLVSIPEDLKNKINNILLDLDKQLISIKKQNIELIKLRDWLLPMLMNGQVTVQ